MIIEKPNKNKNEQIAEIEGNQDTTQVDEIAEVVETNAMIEAYKAIRSILFEIREDPNDPESPPFFKTIKMDNGQLNRIKNSKKNEEYGIAFPAVLIHYIDVYYNQGTSRIAEGRGTMRIHYILNRMNNSDDGEEGELEGMAIYKRIIDAIESKKNTFPSLVSRFQLQYWDQPLSFDDSLQPYWIDYQIWFNDYTAYRYKNYVDAYVIHPPFTQHSDQNETANPDHLPDDKSVVFEDVAKFEDFSEK
ncbi:hypothetical protein [Phocaeicola plebeius]|jgi:hypothetical protein|uniref:hypothetical protein n=1 Tax=Phocaeicola plebeius TaxID=310297 RepID=UPI003AB7813C